jgi:hypothetical protein
MDLRIFIIFLFPNNSPLVNDPARRESSSICLNQSLVYKRENHGDVAPRAFPSSGECPNPSCFLQDSFIARGPALRDSPAIMLKWSPWTASGAETRKSLMKASVRERPLFCCIRFP